MPVHAADLSCSTLSFTDKREFNPDSHFRWNSINKFMYMAFTFSTPAYNFDIFSKLIFQVRIFEFVLFETTIGMAYMFMDCFTKQYTRRLDAYKYLNPLLKGITYGLFLQTALWTLIVSLLKSFKHRDRNALTTRFFVVGLVWLFNFFFSTVSDETLMKIFKLSFLCKSFSTIVTLMILLLTTQYNAVNAFLQILDAQAPYQLTTSVTHVAYAFGIGFLDFFDFGTMSPYTMVDNAVIIFTIIFTLTSFLRSWITRVMYLMLIKCVKLDFSSITTPHYLLFAVLPLSTEFLRAHKMYPIYIYFNIITSTTAYIIMLTLTMSKLLHAEFRSVKNIYLVGLVCCLGFGLSLPIIISMTISSKIKGMIDGINVTVLYLGGFKSAIIMWLYGVRRFSTDIHFWLGFKPTKFWKICWMLLPIVLSSFLFLMMYEIALSKDFTYVISAAIWIAVSILVVTITQIKTIAKYIVRNNLPAVFQCNKRYGPPDPEERERRRSFDEIIQLRQCTHDCQILDDNFECNHMPIMPKVMSAHSIVSSPSVKDIFQDSPSTTRMRTSTLLDIHSHG